MHRSLTVIVSRRCTQWESATQRPEDVYDWSTKDPFVSRHVT